MSILLTADPAAGKARKIAPSGPNTGRIVGIGLLGTSLQTFGGETKKKNRLFVQVELGECLQTFREEDGPVPMLKTSSYTKSMSEKANLRKMLEALRGAPFTRDDLKKGVDLEDILGTPVNVTITHWTNEAGENRDKVAGIGKLHPNLECPEQITPSWVYNVEHHPRNWDCMPPWAQDEVKKSDEWKEKFGDSQDADGGIVETPQTPY